MELVLIGTGGCSAWDVVNILAKGREAVEDCRVELDADRAETEPRVFTRIHLHFVVTGRAVDPAKVARAIDLSIEKYCSASAMLAKTAAITHDFEVVRRQRTKATRPTATRTRRTLPSGPRMSAIRCQFEWSKHAGGKEEADPDPRADRREQEEGAEGHRREAGGDGNQRAHARARSGRRARPCCRDGRTSRSPSPRPRA